MRAPAAELHLWQAHLDEPGWPSAGALPAAEAERAAAILPARSRRRWAASRWALRGVLARYLGEEPTAIELREGEHGKPRLALPDGGLRFNLSHSGDLALVAVSATLEVGVDVERIGARPAAFYAEWTRSEAVAKCHGSGLGAPLPDAPVAVLEIESEPGYAAAVAVAGNAVPPLRRFAVRPADVATPALTAAPGRR